jgi:hypothetical protein
MMTARSAGPKVILENMGSELRSTYPELAEKPFASTRLSWSI